MADPSRYRNRDVRVTGAVVESFSVASRGAYRIDDRTGELWVLTDRGAPRKGERVAVTGTIREGINLGSLGDLLRVPGVGPGLVLIESSHKVRD